MLRFVLLMLSIAVAHASVSVTRSSMDGPHPSTMEIEVQLPNINRKVRIPLTTTEALENVPMTVTENGISRTFSAHQAHHVNHAHYRDIKSKSVVSVRHENGRKRMSGHVMHEGTSYFLEPSGVSNHRATKNRITKLDGIESHIDKRKLTRALSCKNTQELSRTDLEVEILLLVDHTIWNVFKTIYGTDDKALTEIHFYYSHILNGIDTAFRNIGTPSISVKCIGFTVAKTQADAAWMPPAGSIDTNNAGAILGYIKTYSNGKVADHVMAFTRTDIHVGGVFSVTGMAYVSGTCQESRQSIVEDRGLHSWGTASHELAHSLGAADHDDDRCQMALKYLMSPSAGTYSLTDIANSYRFSNCTVNSIKNYINSGNANCLKSRQGIPDPNVTVTNPVGVRMNLNQVCRLVLPAGPGLPFIDGETLANPATICAKILCAKHDGSGISSSNLRAPVGSPCGNKKSCNWNGQCVADYTAPAADEACFFGDSYDNAYCTRWKDAIKSARDYNQVTSAKSYCGTALLICCQSLKTLCTF